MLENHHSLLIDPLVKVNEIDFLLSFTDQFPDPILLVDPKTQNILKANKQSLDILGVNREQLVGRSLSSIFLESPEKIHRDISQILMNHQPITYIDKLASREMDACHQTITLFLFSLKQTEWLCVIIRNSINPLEIDGGVKELTRKIQELTLANQELTEFTSIASHDLKEPLRKIISFASRIRTLRGDLLGARGLEYLNRMQNAAERMHKLINELLRFTQLAVTKETNLEVIDLGQLIYDLLSNLETRIAAMKGQIQINELPKIKADRTQMNQLFQNLIANALKFSKKDIPPQIQIQGHVTQKGYVEIHVSDNGIGFEEKYVERIFQPFQRLHSRSTYEGSGMGLAICQKIVFHHGGTIRAKSQLNEGSTFIVTLPNNVV